MTQEQIVGKNIRNLRESRDWNQEELANKLNISRKTISAWETGRLCPRMGAVEQLKRLFNCTLADILDEKHDVWADTPVQNKAVDMLHEYKNKQIMDLARETVEEQRLLKAFRKCNSEQKRRIIDFAYDTMMEGE